jgi:hypothetical protein
MAANDNGPIVSSAIWRGFLWALGPSVVLWAVIFRLVGLI